MDKITTTTSASRSYWLIESTSDKDSLLCLGLMPEGYIEWGANHKLAMQFARRCDAEIMIEYLISSRNLHDMIPALNLQAVEHTDTAHVSHVSSN